MSIPIQNISQNIKYDSEDSPTNANVPTFWLNTVIIFLLAMHRFKYLSAPAAIPPAESNRKYPQLYFPLTVPGEWVSNISLQRESVAQEP